MHGVRVVEILPYLAWSLFPAYFFSIYKMYLEYVLLVIGGGGHRVNRYYGNPESSCCRFV